MTERVGLGLVGVGKIARDQHLPALAASRQFSLLAAASRHATVETVPTFRTLEAMLAATPALKAVSLCTPPVARLDTARSAIAAGLHVMLEKPPGQTVAEVLDLQRRAADAHVSLFATWHSREAAGVAAARSWLAQRQILQVNIAWQEDVRVWHPGQCWLWEAGGLGVFDPGINALSIATLILPQPLVVESATLGFPENCQAPIVAELKLCHGNDRSVSALFDFRHSGEERWDIEVKTDAGLLLLGRGGASLHLDGQPQALSASAEYSALYRRFADLIASGESDVDLVPLQLVADAFLCGRRALVERFDP